MPDRAGNVIAKQTSIRWNGFMDHLLEPIEQAVIICFAEIIRRQSHNCIKAEIECEFG